MTITANTFYAALIVSTTEVVSRLVPTRNYRILKSVDEKHNYFSFKITFS
jgi:hypothetical protein